MEHITRKNFEEKIKDGVVIVDFYADWCGPCKMLTPILEELSQEMKEVQFYKMDVDKDKKIALTYDIMSIPALLLFKDGKLIAQTQGFSPKTMIKGFIEKAL